MRLKIINRHNNKPFAIPFKRSTPEAESQDEKVTIHSVLGDKEANWQIDRYKVMVVVSILSVFTITGGIIWLASGGGKNANAATPYPTGELDFSEKKETTLRNIPYPSVKSGDKRLIKGAPSTSPSKTPSTSTTPTPTSSPTPTPTSAPSATSTPTPEATATPTPTATPAPTQTPSLTPTPTP